MSEKPDIDVFFRKKLALSDDVDISELSLANGDWDSLVHVSLIFEIEKLWEVRLSPVQMEELNSYAKIKDFLIGTDVSGE